MNIGNNTWISDSVWIDKRDHGEGGELTIGDNVIISHEVIIYTHHHKEMELLNPSKEIVTNNLEIGDNVWIGRKAIIMPPCQRIGENSIIGMGAVVTHDIPSDEVWAGNPAKKIRDRKFINGKDILAHTGSYE